MKHIAIFGPTAVGKTKLSIDLAKQLDAEIISADSLQIYKKLDIGTAKVTPEEMQSIKHHMINILDPSETFDAARFAKQSKKIIKELEGQGKRAIVVGGTGLYIKTLTDGLIDLPTDYSIRAKLELEDPQFLHDRLREIDWEYAAKVPPNNKRKIIRALEVYEITKKPISYMHKFTNSDIKFHKFALIKDREILYDLINKRVDIMIQEGLVEEAEKVFKENPKLQGIGYQELFEFFQKEITLEEAIEKIKQNTRNYAKRQITWARGNNFQFIDVNITKPLNYIIKKISE